jgi:MGT family glycosyltransferase
MSKFLFVPMPITGHVNPGLPIARELVRRGHDVRWYATPRFRRAIENAGARFVPYRKAMPLDEAELNRLFPKRPPLGLPQIRHDLKHLFIGIVPGAIEDLDEEVARERPDVILGDSASVISGVLHERTRIPLAIFGITVLTVPSRDTAPFGLALMPSATPLGRLRNRILYRLVDHVLFRGANVAFQQLRQQMGLAPFRGSLFSYPRISNLYLHSSAPSFEYPRTDLLTQIRFIGATVPDPPPDWTPPSWWKELETHKVVLLTQGTINNDFDLLIRPAIRALADEKVMVIVTTGSRPPSDVEISPLPANVRVEQFIPYRHLMPHVDLLLTNGGYGSIQIALAHGVPVVAIGASEDKPEIANRVNWSGVGVGLKVEKPTEEQIRTTVRQVIAGKNYLDRAAAMQKELAGLDAPTTAADLLEALARG